MVLNIIWMIILGLIVGWIARLIVPGKKLRLDRHRIARHHRRLRRRDAGQSGVRPHKFTVTPPINHAFLGALVGAVILLVAYKFIAGKTKS